jgi:alpha-galactosidase
MQIGPDSRGGEHGSYIMEAFETGRVYRGHFNVPNNGCIPNLPVDAIVEVPGYVDRNGLSIPIVGDLPMGCAAVLNNSVSVQRLAVEAAVRGDVDLLKQAAMLDPLTGAVCDPNEISQMVDEMLVAQARWLPQYADAIPAARSRLRREKRLGTRKTRGAARRQTRSVTEMRRRSAGTRRRTGATDKVATRKRRRARKGTG